MIMHLDYEFNYKNNLYKGVGVDIGETIDLEEEKKDIENLKISAICNEFDLQIDDIEEIKNILNFAKFNYCDLY